MTKAAGLWSLAGMSNVLDDEKQRQILTLGQLGWTLRRIEAATGVRRETAGGYLRAAGIAVRRRGRPGEGPPKPAITAEVSTDVPPPKPATTSTVSTDSAVVAATRAPSASACEPYRELVVEALGRGRNAVAIWQDLVDDHGFTARYASVRRFVLKLRGAVPAKVVDVDQADRRRAHQQSPSSLRAGPRTRTSRWPAASNDVAVGEHELTGRMRFDPEVLKDRSGNQRIHRPGVDEALHLFSLSAVGRIADFDGDVRQLHRSSQIHAAEGAVASRGARDSGMMNHATR